MTQKTQQFFSSMLTYVDNPHQILSSNALELLANYRQAH